MNNQISIIVTVPAHIKVDKSHFRECLMEMLSNMFGSECVNPLIKGDSMSMMVDKHRVHINLSDLVSHRQP